MDDAVVGGVEVYALGGEPVEEFADDCGFVLEGVDDGLVSIDVGL